MAIISQRSLRVFSAISAVKPFLPTDSKVNAGIGPLLTPTASRFTRLSSALSGQIRQDHRPAPILGLFRIRDDHWLPKVKRRRHVYPLSYLPYF